MRSRTDPTDGDEAALVAAAQSGDERAFVQLVDRARPRLRQVLRRLVGDPEDVDDLAQDAIANAWEGLGDFRGEARFSTWLCGIATRLAIDHLRRRKRWRAHAQVAHANACLTDEGLRGEVIGVVSDPSYAFDVKEHISYCLVCVGRSLPPEEHAAFVLRDVLDQSTREAAAALDVSQSVLRHRLSAARARMTATFDGLCALVNKQGVCYQCAGLRDFASPERKGDEPPALPDLRTRCRHAREGDLDGTLRNLHGLFFRQTEAIEEAAGDEPIAPLGTCGQPEESEPANGR